MKKLLISIIAMLCLAGNSAWTMENSESTTINFDESDGCYPLAYPLHKNSESEYFLPSKVSMRTNHQFTIASIEKPGDKEPMLCLIGHDENLQYYAMPLIFMYELDDKITSYNLSTIQIPPIKKPAVEKPVTFFAQKKSLSLLQLSILGLACYGSYQAAQKIITWYKNKQTHQKSVATSV